MPISDPIMAVLDRLPTSSAPALSSDAATPDGTAVPFGVRFAVRPMADSAKHKKTYYTVTVKEATVIVEDGTQKTIQDSVQRERED